MGKDGFPGYAGDSSQTKVHKYVLAPIPVDYTFSNIIHRFMNLNYHEIGYFITQIGLAASSFGVSSADITSIAAALGEAFDVKCTPPTVVDPSQGPQLQSICLADDCPEAQEGDCGPYGPSAGKPIVANATLAMGDGKNGTDSNGTSKTTGSVGPTMEPKPTTMGSPSEARVVLVECWLAVLVGVATLFAFAL